MENIKKNKYWVWLSLIQGLGSKKILKLLEKYNTPDKIYNLSKEELLKIDFIGENLANKIIDNSLKISLLEHLEYMEKNNIEIISIFDIRYPKILKEIYDPPICLYVKGNSQVLNGINLAIVGCRKSTGYGEKAAYYFSYNLSKAGFNIVSGLAKGIDSYSHIGTLAAKGKTIAVIGSGLDNIYPKENIELANKIIKQDGLIITEYPLGTTPKKNNFPARNRIISGLSKAVIVIEAKAKSGTLITADFALEQGRDVFAVPGNINSKNSVGTNELIKQGAIPICNYEDVLKNL